MKILILHFLAGVAVMGSLFAVLCWAVLYALSGTWWAVPVVVAGGMLLNYPWRLLVKVLTLDPTP